MKPRLHVAYTRQGRPTGRVIARMLGANTWGIKPPEYIPDIVVRWGSQKPIECDMEINIPQALARASNKLTALETFYRAGISTPGFTRTWEQMEERLLNMGTYDALILGRSLRGFGGKDIKVYAWSRENRGNINIPYHDWYSMYVGASREYRLHVVGGKVVRIQGKYRDIGTGGEGDIIRNYANGYRFRTPRRDLIPSRKDQAIQAVSVLGLDFGAVDMLVSVGGGPSYVLEVNTAPACSPLTARCYVGALGMLIEERSQGRWECADEVLAGEVNDMPED